MRRPAAQVALAVLLGLGAHLLVVLATDLSPDEAYYAAWSRNLSSTYVDHPPAVAWMIAGAIALLGERELAVRAPALLAGALVPLLLAFAAGRLFGSGAAVRAAWIATGTLLLHALGIITTPDVPLSLAWAAALALVAEALIRARAGRDVPLWLASALGLVCGLALLSKLTAIFLLAGILLAFLWTPALRRALGLRAALVPLVAVLVASPWLVATLAAPGTSDAAFQLARLRPTGFPGVHLGTLVLGQAGLLGPVLAFASVAWIVRAWRRRDERDRVLLSLALPLLAAMVLVALLRRVEANWPGPAWLAAVVGLAGAGLGRLRRPALWTAIPLVLLAHLAAITGLPLEKDPTARLRGWAALGAELEARCPPAQPDGAARLLASGYALGSALSWYAPGCAPLRVLPAGRVSQWDRWPAPPLPASALVVHPEGRPPDLPGHCTLQNPRSTEGRTQATLTCRP